MFDKTLLTKAKIHAKDGEWTDAHSEANQLLDGRSRRETGLQ
jgi:hypothetical protein